MLLAVALPGCSPSGRRSSPPLPVDWLTTYENWTLLRIDSSFAVAAFSQRLPSGDSESALLAYRAEDSRWHEVFRRKLESSYNARLELRRDMPYSGSPIVVLRVQQGAAAETQEVFGAVDGSLLLLQSLDAGAFEWRYRPGAGKTELDAIPASSVDPCIHYHWNGERFEPVESPAQ